MMRDIDQLIQNSLNEARQVIGKGGSLEATATCLAEHDAVANPGMPEQTSPPNSPPAESWATEPTLARENTADVASSNDTAGDPPTTSSRPAPEAVSADSVASRTDSCAANSVVRISGITEMGRDGATSRLNSWKPPFEVQRGFEASFSELVERAELVRYPMNAVPVPTRSIPYGTADELFARLQKAIAAHACQPERVSRSLAYWTLAC